MGEFIMLTQQVKDISASNSHSKFHKTTWELHLKQFLSDIEIHRQVFTTIGRCLGVRIANCKLVLLPIPCLMNGIVLKEVAT